MPLGNAPPAVQAEDDLFRAAFGVQSWNILPNATPGSGSALTSQTIYATAVPYRAGQVVTRVGWVVQTIAAGTTPTGFFCGLCSATTMLMDSANLAANAAWTSQGMRTVPLFAPFTIRADGIYFHLILLNGAFSVTQPLLNRLTNPTVAGAQIDGAGAFFCATIGVGQTALPAVNAAVVLSTAGAPQPWMTFST